MVMSAQLRTRAHADGVDPDVVEQARDGDDPKGDLIAAIIELAGKTEGGATRSPTADDLVIAAFNGELAPVKSLLESSVDVNSKNDAGYSALFEAARAGHVDVARLLLEHGARVEMTGSPLGSTALVAAAQAL